jgi:DtxR family Mn-dependent transcriptional regulator
LTKPLFNDTSENVEEYLEALWVSKEAGNPIAKISWVAKRLRIASPSVVEMFKKLADRGFVKYYPYRGVRLAKVGYPIARRVIRHHRLIEVLMKQTLSINVDENIACGIEHHMTEEFANALCTLLKHPQKCPHGSIIPTGRCCNNEEITVL